MGCSRASCSPTLPGYGYKEQEFSMHFASQSQHKAGQRPKASPKHLIHGVASLLDAKASLSLLAQHKTCDSVEIHTWKEHR